MVNVVEAPGASVAMAKLLTSEKPTGNAAGSNGVSARLASPVFCTVMVCATGVPVWVVPKWRGPQSFNPTPPTGTVMWGAVTTPASERSNEPSDASLLRTWMTPPNVPAAVALNCTVNVVEAPASRVVAPTLLTRENPAGSDVPSTGASVRTALPTF